MNPPDDTSLLTWFVDHWWLPFVGAVTGVLKFNHAAHRETRKIAADALGEHKGDDEKEFKSLREEQATQRGHIAKVFDQMRDDRAAAEARHRELMTSVHDNHAKVLVALNSKADK